MNIARRLNYDIHTRERGKSNKKHNTQSLNQAADKNGLNQFLFRKKKLSREIYEGKNK